jgi:hypothetical protein
MSASVVLTQTSPSLHHGTSFCHSCQDARCQYFNFNFILVFTPTSHSLQHGTSFCHSCPDTRGSLFVLVYQ